MHYLVGAGHNKNRLQKLNYAQIFPAARIYTVMRCGRESGLCTQIVLVFYLFSKYPYTIVAVNIFRMIYVRKAVNMSM